MKCQYCKTENAENQTRCTFCEADLLSARPVIREIDITDVLKTVQEKRQYHTFNLLEMLQIARKERSDAYNMLRIVLKAGNEVEVDKDLKNSVEEQYRLFTAHVNVLQELLIDRIGYYPKRIDEKLLERYLSKCQKN